MHLVVAGGKGTQADSSLRTAKVEHRLLDDDRDLSPGVLLGRYHVLERIGAGGMGVVYAAFDPDLDRKVALKVLHPERLEGDAGSRGHARLIREAKAMAKLAHPNVVAVHDVGVFDDRVFVAMEFVQGQTLTKWLAERPPWQEVISCLTRAGKGLAAAHAEGLVHRDFKPDNVLLGTDGRPRVLDFGLARSAGDAKTEPREPVLDDVSLEARMRSHDFADRITRTGGLTGTPAYMAPEQYLGKTTDARTDQFSFCVVLWEGLYGERPFRGESTAALGLAICSGELDEPPANTPVPARIHRALLRGLSQSPADRFESIAALLAAISVAPRRSTGRLWWGAGGATIAVGAFATFAGAQPDPCGGGEARVSEVWNEDHAGRLRSSFDASGTSFADDSAAMVVEHLDAYVSQWSDSHRDACEATHVRHEQSSHALDLRMGCLSRHLRALQSTVETLQDADESVVKNAPRAIGRLPPLGACNDVEALDTWARPPEDPDLASTVQDIRERIAGLEAQARLATRDSYTAAAQTLRDDARATGYGPLIAEAEYLAARYAILSGDSQGGVEHLEETVYAALASDHDHILASAFTQLAQTSGILLSDYEDGLRWGRHAAAAIERLGEDGEKAAEFHNVMCKLLADKGDTEQALPHCHQNLAILERLHGEGSLAAAYGHESLGIALFYAHQSEDALLAFERARDGFAAVEGDSHPDLARVANSLAAICFQSRDAQACVEPFEDAVRRAVAAYGDEHPMTADFRNNFAMVLIETGEVERARATARQALSARRALSGNDHPGVAASLRILAQVDTADGDLESALKTLIEARAIAVSTRGAVHRDVAVIDRHLAEVELARGDREAAHRHLDTALESAKTLNMDLTALRKVQEQLAAAE